MGIKGLMKFLQEAAPKSITEKKGQDAYTGRIIAIDASMQLYQFLIMIREGSSGTHSNLTNEAGEVTSHIIGMLSRTLKLMENGIKPVYVFDGKPPELKMAELEERRAKRAAAQIALTGALAEGNSESVLKASKATVKVTKEQNEQAKRLLTLMGLPVVNAPSEAEATCAALCRDGCVHASATEDADCLTFGTRLLIRNLTAPEAQKRTILEVNLSLILEQLNVTMTQFIDFCILCGCDYCDSIKGVGPQNAIKLIMEHGSIEKILEVIGQERKPANFNYQVARDFFIECEAVKTSEAEFKNFEFKEPDFEGLQKFLTEEMSFNPDRVEKYMERLRNAKTKTKQRPLDSFFGVVKKNISESDKFDPTKKKGGAGAKAKAKAKGGRPAGGGPPGKRAKTL